MKKSIFTMAAIVCIAGTLLTGCQSSADKVRNAQDKLQDANQKVEVASQELNKALGDSIQQFRQESEARLNENENSIAEYKIKINKEKVGNRARYQRQLADLEQQNLDMRRDLEAFNDVQREKWDSFRLRFKHDMDKHAKAVRDFWTGGR